jgi:hypothetical protein
VYERREMIPGDNRRLWLFRQLEKLGRCSTIEVNEISSIPNYKFTTENGGAEITVRGNPESSYARDVVWESRKNLPKYVRPDEFGRDYAGDSDNFHYGDTDSEDDFWLIIATIVAVTFMYVRDFDL